MAKVVEISAEIGDNDRNAEMPASTPASLTSTPVAGGNDGMADAECSTGKSPAFQFYPKDFLSDSHVMAMTLAEVGAYTKLLCFCWLDRSIPDDVPRLARMCGVTRFQFQRIWPEICPCFRLGPVEGSLVHPRLERERAKQAAYREAARQGGLLSAAKRKASGVGNRLEAKGNRRATLQSPVSDLQSPISEVRTEDQEISFEPQAAPKPAVLTFPIVGSSTTTTWPLTQDQFDAWVVLYPNLDILSECRKALAWVSAHSERRKTVRGMPKFLVGWLSRATDRNIAPAVPAGGARKSWVQQEADEQDAQMEALKRRGPPKPRTAA